MVWKPIRQIQSTEPTIRQVQENFLAQSPFRPDAGAVPNQKHPDQEFGINRRTARVAVEIRQMLANTAQICDPVN